MDSPMDLGALKNRKCLVITGTAGSGKDTLADMIEAYVFGTGGFFNRIRFSDPLKDLACSLFGWDRDRIGEQEYKSERLPAGEGVKALEGPRILKSRRKILQYLGTDVFRKMDADIWVKAALRRAVEGLKEFNPDRSQDFIATDCRFANESAALCEAFAETRFVRLVCRRAGEYTSDSHESEQLQGVPEDVRYTVDYGDLDRLRLIARGIVDYEFKGGLK